MGKLKAIQSHVARMPTASTALAMVQKQPKQLKRPKLEASDALAKHDGLPHEREEQGGLRERALLVRFSVGRWYGTGADEQVTAQVKEDAGATGDIGNFTKRFMSRDKLAQINAITGEARKFYKTITLPWSDGGSRLLSAEAFFTFKSEMLAFEGRFGTAVREFLERYPDFIDQERERLGKLFKQHDYPTVDQLRERFRFSLAIDALPNADDFRVALGAEEVQRIRQDIEQRVEHAVHEASQSIWERMQEIVTGIKERLQDNVVRETLLQPLKELVQLMPALNITNDPALTKLAEQAAQDLLAFDVDELRGKDAEPSRKLVANKADAILKQMSSFTGKKGGA